MSMHGERLPYPGLRSFTREETDLFFGREGCVDQMVDRLAETRFLAVLGASGSGKSSLVKTGLLDALELGFLASAGSHWLIADFKPGDSPIANMAEGLLKLASPDPTRTPSEEEIGLLRAFLARSPRSIVEWCADNLPAGANMLLLVDQFEELFRYSQYAEREEAEAFVALLLESARAPLEEARIYVAITMRSEYLGAAALIDGLAEAINKGLYLTPRMSREEVRDAIVGPAAVCGFSIEPALVNRLLNDLTTFAPWDEEDTGHQLERLVRRADQLPLMQHVLNRLWSLAEPQSGGAPAVLTLKDYIALGGLRGALGAHGREVLDSLLPEHKDVASAVFRALTAGSSIAEAVRRPTEFGELVEIAGGDELAVREVVEAFRAPGRNFLMPPRPLPLRAKTVIDISHESLIRQWDQFGEWLRREITSAETWRRLLDAAERYKRGEANLLSGLELTNLANWWDTEAPTAAWAKRYGGNFEEVQNFLAESRKAEEANKRFAEAQGQRERSRRRVVYAAILILCIITPLTLFAGYQAWQASQEAARANEQTVLANEQAELAQQQTARANMQAEEADAARQAAEAERQRADAEAQAAFAAQQEAIAQAAAADEARRIAEEERLAAVEARQDAEAERQAAEEARQAAEMERQRADVEAEAALAAQQNAIQEAADAEAARALADEQRRRAEEQRQLAETAQRTAEEERQAAEEARRIAEEQRQLAEAERQRADDERLRALMAAEAEALARQNFQQANLELVGDRVWSLQQASAWDAAANLLGHLWNLVETGGEVHEDWLIEPVRAAFAGQSRANYPIFPEFMIYNNLEGWYGTTGRFRVYAVKPAPPEDGSTVTSNTTITIFDTVTGATTGSFELPNAADLGSELDHVAPDGTRAVIVTNDGNIALWSKGMDEPVLIPVPPADNGEVDVGSLSPVNSDPRFALVLDRDAVPSEVVLIDPDQDAITFSISAAEMLLAAGLESIDSLQIIGFFGNELFLLVNTDRVLIVQTPSKIVRELETGGGIIEALLTPDGKVLLGLSCPGVCTTQILTAFDPRNSERLWVEPVRNDLYLSELAVQTSVVEGKVIYSALAENEGSGVVITFPADNPRDKTVHDVGSVERVGVYSYDGEGGFRFVDTAAEDLSSEGVAAAGMLANYRLPLDRQKLLLYVAPNSVAVFQDGETSRIAGVTYDGDLAVYRESPSGMFEEDLSFPTIPVGHSNCISAISFGGDGRSLLLRHIEGAIRYVAAIGSGASIDWRMPLESGSEQSMQLIDASPATDCELPDISQDAAVERIVPVDLLGTKFALLDRRGVVWWANVGEADGGELSEGIPARERDFAPLARAAAGMMWVAGDPARGRAAMVSAARRIADDPDDSQPAMAPPAVVDIVPSGASLGKDGKWAVTSTDAESGSEEREGATAEAMARAERLPRHGEPKAVTFDPDGNVAVAYAGGQLFVFTKASGTWAVKFEGPITKLPVTALFATADKVAIADDTDLMIALDARTGALSGHARIPANPSVLALGADGTILSIEYDTDAIARHTFAELPPAGEVVQTARLVAMRSQRDEEPDTSIDALTLDREMERSVIEGAVEEADCVAEERRRLALIERRLLGDAAEQTPIATLACGEADQGGSLMRIAGALAESAQDAGVIELVADEDFSRLLETAADGDAVATRLLGAALSRIAVERGDVTPAAVAADAFRFGTSVPNSVLRAVAAGAAIDEATIALAAESNAADAGTHQLLAHASARRINDLDALSEAMFQFGVAERLYTESGRDEDARFVRHRRAQIARLLPDALVLAVWERLAGWTPPTPPAVPPGEVANIPEDPVERNKRDLQNIERLAERFPDSSLLAALTTELDRTRILQLAERNPQEAAQLLRDLAQDSGSEGWSPDLVREYLALAEHLSESDSRSAAFEIAAEAVGMVTSAFAAPIHTDADTVALFRSAAEIFVATAATAPVELVAAQADSIDLSLTAYEYATLPAIGAEAEIKAAEQVLESAANVAEAIGTAAADADTWLWRRGEALFWQGVLANDYDSTKASSLLRESTEVLRPVVEAKPEWVDPRFRYAEALRWVGLAESSDAPSQESEEEAIRQYEVIWAERLGLDPVLAQAVGTGYGFGLANLAQTMRERELADMRDGRTAEDHAGWVLEILALAAEKDALNTTLIDEGILGENAAFVGGWYSMSSYGWPIGFLAGLVNIENGAGEVTRCDLLASDPYDPGRAAPGIPFAELDGAAAEEACRAENNRRPDDARTIYQLARAMSVDSSRSAEYVPLAQQAADLGIAPAQTMIAEDLGIKEDAGEDAAYLTASQQTIIAAFPVLYPYLERHAETERERAGLRWFVEQAANLGVPEAHSALAKWAKDAMLRREPLEVDGG